VVLKPSLLLLAGAALASCAVFSTVPTDGWHPLAVQVSLLPLQLVALFWALRQAPKAAVSRRVPAPTLPASAGSPPAGHSAGV
jgi:uncharacterized protein (DUF58 family)